MPLNTVRLSGCDGPSKHIAEIVKARRANPTIPILCGISLVERIWRTRPHELRETKFAMIVVILFVRWLVLPTMQGNAFR
jgi:hypothetical protein